MVFPITPFVRRVILSKPISPSFLGWRNLIHWKSAAVPSYGTSTPLPEDVQSPSSKCPFYFQTGYAVCPKRPSRPFPPPFVSPPSSSFSDPLTTHDRSQDTRPSVDGELIRGLTNGDDAFVVSQNLLGVNDGVGAWATKPQGHAALWSRLILHFWTLEAERQMTETGDPDPVEFLQRAYEQTVTATSSPNEWFGTTTSATALLHCREDGKSLKPTLYATNLGDCQVLVIRQKEERVIFTTEGQWHWFDCPMQLGTNSVDRPRQHATLSMVDLEEDDIVMVMSDGVTDNLWGHEVLDVVLKSVKQWETGKWENAEADHTAGRGGGMVYVAQQLLKTAKAVAQDPSAQTPYMKKAVDEGLAIEGGKMDDISIVAGLCAQKGG